MIRLWIVTDCKEKLQKNDVREEPQSVTACLAATSQGPHCHLEKCVGEE